MKKSVIFSFLFLFLFACTSTHAQTESDSTGLLGDNFSLEGALEAFKNAPSLEKFEEELNNQEKYINNLDLNEDGEIDYIRVEDTMDGDVHAIVLQALVSEDEVQDIAVIEIEKTGDESATLQIVGDEYLYGEDFYVEPFEEEAKSDGSGGPSANYEISRIVVNVWYWPSVRFIYNPGYVVYRSPFRWGVYPRVWRPWRPFTWRVYHGNRIHYHRNYRVTTTHRVTRARTIYAPKRKTSNTVVRRSTSVTRVRSTKNGNKVVTRKTNTTKVRKNNNGTKAAKKTKTSTTVRKGKNGKKGKVTRTKTKKVKKKGN